MSEMLKASQTVKAHLIIQLLSNTAQGRQSNDTFSDLALKLRMQKFDREQILQYKHEAVQNEKIKKKKKRAALKIQRIFRGIHYRKKFKRIM